MILAAMYAVKFGLTIDDLSTTCAPYLTMSEDEACLAGVHPRALEVLVLRGVGEGPHR